MQPLADLLRPSSLDTYVGQSHLVGVGSPLWRTIETKTLHSMIFWGPPGCGKTTLAKIIAQAVDADFHYLSAVSAKKDDIKTIINKSREHGNTGLPDHSKIILFLDEIHRFTKAQQDYLLPYVENGLLTLIGATTENPSFEVIGPLLSRCQIYVLKGLSNDELIQLISQGSKALKVKVTKDASEFLATFANGDGRKALNALETTATLQGLTLKDEPNPKTLVVLTKDMFISTLQSPYLRYDQSGEEHYNTISAFIKSMRASQTDAALYYLARMISSGEDPIFIARRMVIFASEDIGIAVPTALVVANAVLRAVETIGYPECGINLAHGVVYLCQCKKNRSAHDAFRLAQADVALYGNLPIPMKLRNFPTQVSDEAYLPDKIKNQHYF